MKIEKVKNSRLKSIDFENLPFGKYFSDHMLICKYNNDKWQEPFIQPYQNISVSPCAQVFHYGQSCFEGMKAYRNNNDIFLSESIMRKLLPIPRNKIPIQSIFSVSVANFIKVTSIFPIDVYGRKREIIKITKQAIPIFLDIVVSSNHRLIIPQ